MAGRVLVLSLLLSAACFSLGEAKSASSDFYSVLGVESSATTKEITRAYRKLALKYHPDKHTDGDKAEMEATFTNIVNAYEVLKDEESRSKYDAGQLSDSEAHRHRDFRSAAAAAGMGHVQDTPFAWVGIAVSILAAAAPAAYVALQQRASNRSKPKPMSAADAALKALASDGQGADASAAADAAREASASNVKQAAAAQRARNKAKAEAAADAQAAASRSAHLTHVATVTEVDGSDAALVAHTRSGVSPSSAGGTPDLTPEVLSQLSRALSKYPGGTRGRFDRVAEFMGGGLAACDVAAMVTALRRRSSTQASPPPSTPHAASSQGGDPKQGPEWSQAEQLALETALKAWVKHEPPPKAGAEGGGADPKAVRKAAAAAKWKWIASQAGLSSRSASQCLARFKFCASTVG